MWPLKSISSVGMQQFNHLIRRAIMMLNRLVNMEPLFPSLLFDTEPPKGLLYHYCSMSTFMSIVEKKKLWLTSTKHMNDLAEGRWLLHMVRQCVSESQNLKNMPEKESFLTTVAELAFPEKFMCCFSEHGDLLSQWRGYADNAQGVAIGFDYNKMNIERRPTLMSANGGHTIGIMPVIYDKQLQCKIINKLLQLFIKCNNSTVTEAEIANQIASCSTFFKNAAFIEEKEWRIIYTPMIDNNFTVFGKYKDIKFRAKNKYLSPYFEYPFEDTPGILSKIVLGPQNYSDERDLAIFLDRNHLPSVNIERSSATFISR